MTNPKRFVNRNMYYTVEIHDGVCAVHEYDTDLDDSVVEELLRLKDDKTATVMDMYKVVLPLLPDTVVTRINYLAPISYDDRYVDGAIYPKPMKPERFEVLRTECIESAARELEEECLRLWPPEKFGDQWRSLYAREVNLRQQQAVDDLIYGQKVEYFGKIRHYLYAWYYRQALKRDCIFERLGKDVKMYSSDVHGHNDRGDDSDFIFPITDKIVVHLHTNFAYGYSSKFILQLTYEGIAIVPYSFYVVYYYANSRDLSKYTRMFALNRGSWKVAFDFVVEAANLASQDPDRFIDVFVVQEIAKMVDGLREMIANPQRVMDSWLSRTNRDKPSKYITVREVDKDSERIYACYPGEMLTDFKVRKISNSLDFLDSLKALKPIYGNVESAINDIKSMAVSILPEIETAVNQLHAQMDGLDKVLGGWKKRYASIGKRLEALRSQKIGWIENKLLAMRREGVKRRFADVRKELSHEYDIAYPSYSEHVEALAWCDHKIKALRSEMRQRQAFMENLCDARNRIKNDKELNPDGVGICS